MALAYEPKTPKDKTAHEFADKAIKFAEEEMKVRHNAFILLRPLLVVELTKGNLSNSLHYLTTTDIADTGLVGKDATDYRAIQLVILELLIVLVLVACTGC